MITSTLWTWYGEKIGTTYAELNDAIEIAKTSELRFVVACDAGSAQYPWYFPTNTPELYGAICWMNEELYSR